MKYFSLLVLVFISVFAIAQDYQTFRSSDIHYFRENNEGLMLASQIDSTDFSGGDSIFYPFTSLRFGGHEDMIETASWMGEKIVVRNDGMNLFFNQNSDTIFISTQAEIGDSFTLFTYESGNTVEATVTSIDEEFVFDVLDSVKTFELTSEEASFDFDTPSFRIGKASGMLDIYPFYSFPNKYAPIYGPNTVSETYELIGQLYPRKGITKPTNFDVSNLEVGDVIQYESYYPAHLITKRLTILSKALIGSDDVEYEMESYTDFHYDGTSPEDPSIDSLYTTTLTDTFSISEDFINPHLIPEKDYGEGVGDYSFELFHNETCGFSEIFQSYGSYRVFGDSVGIIFEPVITSNSVYSRSLWPYSTYYHNTGTDIYDYGSNFLSGKYDETVCGEGSFLNLDEMMDKKEVSIYPNPTNGSFYVKIDGEFELNLFSTDGRLVYSNNKQTSMDMVEVNLPNGIYLITITQNGTVYNRKVVINK